MNNKKENEEKKPLSKRPKDSEIAEVLQKNLELNEKIHRAVHRIDNYIFWQRIFGIVKIIIIVVPLVIMIVILPPILTDLIEQYKNLLGITKTMQETNAKLEGVDMNSVSPDILKMFK